MNNLRSWQKGQSGNPEGRPKGSRNIRTIIRDLMESEETFTKIDFTEHKSSTPLEAIICVLIKQSLEGDLKATSLLLGYMDGGADLSSRSSPIVSYIQPRIYSSTGVESTT